jgi:glyoxylase I family protein
MAEIDGFEHVNVTVRDVRASVAWYADLLGLEQVWEEDSEEHGWSKVGLYHPGSGMRLNLTQHRAGSGEPFSERRTGLDHLAFRVPGGRPALEAWLARLEERGVEHSPIKRSAIGDTHFGDVITLRDPDNVQLELYAPAG